MLDSGQKAKQALKVFQEVLSKFTVLRSDQYLPNNTVRTRLFRKNSPETVGKMSHTFSYHAMSRAREEL